MDNKIKVGSFFAGVGGIDLGLEQTNHFEVVYANEIDLYPIETYENNFKIKVDHKDIVEVDGNQIPDFDMMIGGFPCQAFSVAGYRQGFNDELGRGTLFFELIRLLKEKKKKQKQPSIVFFENVKNLVGHDKGNTFTVILNELHKLGYYVKYKVLNASEYGNIPQNRERIYIVGFLNKESYRKFDFPLPIPLNTTIKDIINFDEKVDDKYYYTKERCKFYDELEKNMISTDSIYQWRRIYVRENKSNLCPTLTANMGTGGHNVPLIKTKYGIRKLTPKECFLFQGFPDDFNLPENLSNTRLYKQAGNSVVVPIIEKIGQNIYQAIS